MTLTKARGKPSDFLFTFFRFSSGFLKDFMASGAYLSFQQ
jgi:hypothetical protein